MTELIRHSDTHQIVPRSDVVLRVLDITPLTDEEVLVHKKHEEA
jgi:hypothetical protein